MRRTVGVFAATAIVAGSFLVSPDAAFANGCAGADKGGDWGSFGGDAWNTRSQPSEKTIDAAAAPHLEAAWTFSLAAAGADGNFQSTPAVADGCVYVASSTGWVFAINASSGKVVWKEKAGAGGISNGIFGLAVARGKVVANVSSPKGPFAVGLDQSTGRELWRSPVLDKQDGAWTNASAKVLDDLLFYGLSGPEGVAEYKGKFAILDIDDGRVLKVTQVISDKENKKGYGGAGVWSTPAFDPASNYAYVGSSNPYGTKEHHLSNAILKIDMDRDRRTFGEIVDAYKGDVDQYYPPLAALEDAPTCGPFPETIDHPECGQIDLDFGASPTLFRNSDGKLVVAALQKSGVVHAAYADSMEKAWSTIVGAPCAVCNVSSTAWDGKKTLFAAGSPGSALFGLDVDTGSISWASPIADGTHYQPVSYANGVVYTTDTKGNFDSFDASIGVPAFSRPMSADVGDACTSLSGGVAIAHSHVYATCDLGVGGGGWLIAYGYDEE